MSVNRAKPTCEELKQVFDGHIANNTLVMTDGLKSYGILKTIVDCAVVDVNMTNTNIFNAYIQSLAAIL